jgi:O-antigen ligase
MALIAVGIASLAPFGMNWLYKLAGIRTLVEAIPAPLLGLFSGAESGFHPNQVAGTLLYTLPLLLALSAREIRGRAAPLRKAATFAAALVVAAILVLTQSRAGLLGFGVSGLAMLLLPMRWGRRVLLALALAFLAFLPVFPGSLIDLVSDAPGIEALGRANTIGFRQSVWQQSVAAIRTVPWTGLGFGTYRDLIWRLYPLDFGYSREVFHAHNFFLQTALDFGVPGLIALVALYLVAVVQVTRLWARAEDDPRSRSDLPWRYLALGFSGSLVAQLVYSLLDAVAMGAKTNFVFWYVLALLMGSANLAGSECSTEAMPHAGAANRHIQP